MSSSYANALTDVVKRTVNFMFPVEARLLEKRCEDNREAPFEVSGIIGLTGSKNRRGTVVISFPQDVARQLAAWMLTEEDANNCSDQDISDCVGELANIVGGNLLPLLMDDQSEEGAAISLPSVVVGDHRVVWGSKDTPCDLMIFETEVGQFAAEINYREALVDA